MPFAIEEDPTPDAPNRPHAGFRAVSSGFFETMRIPILSGRGFSTFDRIRQRDERIASHAASIADTLVSRQRAEEAYRRMHMPPSSMSVAPVR